MFIIVTVTLFVRGSFINGYLLVVARFARKEMLTDCLKWRISDAVVFTSGPYSLY